VTFSGAKRRGKTGLLAFGKWTFGWMGSGKLSDKDKYEITSWAFSYFMRSNLTIADAVAEAVRKRKPDKVNRDGSLGLSQSDFLDLQLRVKNML
jgi:hypothetical protein